MAIDGRRVFDIITNGWKRTVIEVGGNGSLGVSIPADATDDLNIDQGDDVAIRPKESDDKVLELYFDADE